MFKANSGSTRNLIQLCIGYFIFYVITGVTVKYFLGSADQGLPAMKGLEFLVYSTLGGNAVCISYVLLRRWYKMEYSRRVQIGPFSIPVELMFIIPSGICTAVVIPTTTLMYTLPISVMVAMVIMRGAVIVISRIIDAIQIKQGILHKKVYKEENIAVGFAVAAIGVHTLWAGEGSFDFLGSAAAMSILLAYVTAYSIRIYIMNYFKNTAGKGVKRDNKAFFAIEQMAATVAILTGTLFIYNAPTLFNWTSPNLEIFRAAIHSPLPQWGWATLAGSAFGMAAFFSVFLFMFKGRTATFAGLVNRLTSLIAGTTATLVFHFGFGGRFPKTSDWVSLLFIFIAVGFLTRAERKRSYELAHSKDEEERHIVEDDDDNETVETQTAAA